MAYLKGVLDGDGSLSWANGTLQFRLGTISGDFAAEFLAAAFQIAPRMPRVYFRIERNTHLMYDVVSNWVGWSEQLKEDVKEFWSSWLKGFIDSEGSVTYIPRNSIRMVEVGNSNKALLNLCQFRLYTIRC